MVRVSRTASRLHAVSSPPLNGRIGLLFRLSHLSHFALRRYSHQLTVRPHTTNMVSAGILWGGGDYITQKYIERPEQLDLKRLASVSAYGTVIAGPLYLWWYSMLDRRTSHLLTGVNGSIGKYIGAKIFADQVLFEPLNLSLYFMATKVMEGQSVPSAAADLKSHFPILYLTDTAIWPIAQYINFRVRCMLCNPENR